MKKILVVIILIITVLTFNKKVFAQDTFKSINKYEEEKLEYIIKGYNKDKKYDGLVVAGTYQKKKEEKEDTSDTQLLLVKYDKSGKIIWEYDYGKTAEDKLFYLSYSYNDNEIDGYIITANETSELEENKTPTPVFIKVGLDGKIISETNTQLPVCNINKVIDSYNSENVFDGYILIGTKNIDNKEVGFIAKYNINLEQEWLKEITDDNYSKINIEDLVLINDSYKAIISYENENEKKIYLKKLGLSGEEIGVIKDDFDSQDTPKILGNKDSYIVYGFDHNVKLKNDKNTTYYLIKYNSNDEEEWETLSNTATNDKKKIELSAITKEDEVKEYLLMSTNDNDSSIEITKITKDGEIKNKIKKINNEYYFINDFIFSDNILYFVGQVSCPEDDNCDYDMKSLFLISTEDKVIEVKEDDNTAILVVSGALIIFTILLYVLRRYQKSH